MVKNKLVHVTGWFLGLWCLGCLGCGGSVPLENWQKLGGRVSLDQQGEVESLYLGQTRVTAGLAESPPDSPTNVPQQFAGSASRSRSKDVMRMAASAAKPRTDVSRAPGHVCSWTI